MRRLQMLSWIVIAVLALDALLSVAGIASDISEHNLARQVLSGAFAPDIVSKAQAADDRAHTIAVTEIVLYAETVILFIAWFHQAYKNVARLGVAGMRWSSGWAIGSWFVPILNLIRPKQITNDIWRGSDPDLRIGSTLGQNDPPLLYQLWWARTELSRGADDGTRTHDLLPGKRVGVRVPPTLLGRMIELKTTGPHVWHGATNVPFVSRRLPAIRALVPQSGDVGFRPMGTRESVRLAAPAAHLASPDSGQA